MNWSLLASSYGAVFGNVQVLLMTFLGALGGVLLGAIPGMTATMGVALLSLENASPAAKQFLNCAVRYLTRPETDAPIPHN